MASQILGEAVGHGDGAARQQQFHGHRATHDVGGADNNGVHSVQVLTGAFQQGHDAFRGARAQQWNALGQTAYVIRVETVDVFVRADALQQAGSVQMLRQRQLQQDTVDVCIIIKTVDQVGQRLLSGVGRQVIGL